VERKADVALMEVDGANAEDAAMRVEKIASFMMM